MYKQRIICHENADINLLNFVHIVHQRTVANKGK